jgi:hypothetical protein
VYAVTGDLKPKQRALLAKQFREADEAEHAVFIATIDSMQGPYDLGEVDKIEVQERHPRFEPELHARMRARYRGKHWVETKKGWVCQ